MKMRFCAVVVAAGLLVPGAAARAAIDFRFLDGHPQRAVLQHRTCAVTLQTAESDNGHDKGFDLLAGIFFSILAQASFSVTVRLKTGWAAVQLAEPEVE